MSNLLPKPAIPTFSVAQLRATPSDSPWLYRLCRPHQPEGNKSQCNGQAAPRHSLSRPLDQSGPQLSR
jgi:hypothetical protein